MVPLVECSYFNNERIDADRSLKKIGDTWVSLLLFYICNGAA